MRYRVGFVTNSSSSSFVISKHHLTPYQIELIHNHLEVGESFNIYGDKYDRWTIDEDDYAVRGSVFMDNFSMSEFFEKIGVDLNKVDWGY